MMNPNKLKFEGTDAFRLKKLRIRPTVRRKTEKTLMILATIKKTRVGFVIFSSINLLLKYIMRCATDPNKHYICSGEDTSMNFNE